MDLSKVDPITPQGWVNAAIGFAAAATMWAFKRTIGRIDRIEAHYMPREEIQAAFDKRDAALATMHGDNLQNFREIRTLIETTNGRLFDIAKNLTPK